jgi:hypothetical protein
MNAKNRVKRTHQGTYVPHCKVLDGLSFLTQQEQFEQHIRVMWPRPVLLRWRGAEWKMQEWKNTNARLIVLGLSLSDSTCVYVPPKPLTNMHKHSSC